MALMLLVNAYLPTPVAPQQQQANGIDKSTIRIVSRQKGPERVEIDTSLPTIVPSVDVAQAQIQPSRTVERQAAAEAAKTVEANDAYAQMPATSARHVAATAKKSKVRIARTDAQRRIAQPTRVAMRVQQQPSLFANFFGGWQVR
ncbi:hypothetical protein [Bradyrhizobium sp. 2TAF24]|uniref:hypothetical protein n=1 Tax=Bradyrhizobium sp. 2TAF24 TaxID=3233011 RepID=UPI003F8E953E